MTKSHEDKIKQGGEDYGYSIRVGKKLPPNSVNLAYVHTPEINPEVNLTVTDLSSAIPENTIEQSSTDTLLFPDDNFLLREIGRPFTSSSRHMLITDEFSIPENSQEIAMPLYYKTELKGYFDPRRSSVIEYISGFKETPISNSLQYEQIKPGQKGRLLYLSSKIRITHSDGTPLKSQEKYKIELIQQEGVGVPIHAYRVVIYTNFKTESDNGYLIRYERYNRDGTHTSDHVELLNVYPFYKQVEKSALDALAQNPKESGSWSTALKEKHYAIAETEDQTWEVYAPSQVLIADNKTRPAHQFSYRVKAKLRTKFARNTNEGSIKIGVIYLNNTVFNAEDLGGVLKTVYEHPLKPPYLDFENPHHPFVGVALSEEDRANLKRNPKYFHIDVNMPSDYLNEYDMIVLTGYGSYDMSLYNDNLRGYLQNGGRLWIDNAGTGNEALELQNFSLNIGFSKTVNSLGTKAYGIPEASLSLHDPYSVQRQAVERLYLINKQNIQIGYPLVNPKIVFGVGESADIWQTIVRYSNNDPSVITRKAYDAGQIIVSNCGVFRTLANRNTEDIRFAMNIILSTAEEKIVTSPWLKDYVYYRDNLFKEEYKNGQVDVYIDERSDVDSSQIVAKKMMAKSMREALLPYMPSAYYSAKGEFTSEVAADSQILVTNNDFEVGAFNSQTKAAVTSWNETTDQAIPGWNTNAVEGIILFRHSDSLSERGKRSVSISSETEARGHWSTIVNQLTADSYRLSLWVKTNTLSGGGATVRVLDSKGVQLSSRANIVGSTDWTKIELTFSVTKTTDILIQAGFITEGITGSMMIDFVELFAIGSVYMTPKNTGDRPLYAYAVRPRPDSFDLQKEGFSSADVTIYDPKIEILYTIASFAYMWNNEEGKYIKQYGNSKSYKTSIRKSDGILNLGLLTTLLPGLNAGTVWADKSKVFYEITVGEVGTRDSVSNFVNIGFFHTKKGQYSYTKNGSNVIGYQDLFGSDDNQLFTIVQAWTDYYTIRATKRRYAIRQMELGQIKLKRPATIDEKDSWYVRVQNGEFSKVALNYGEVQAGGTSRSQNKNYGKMKYALPEFDRQVFSPSRPYKSVMEEGAEYVDEYTIQVQKTPLHVLKGEVHGEELKADIEGILYQAEHGHWQKDLPIRVYIDQKATGDFILISNGYDVDYEKGTIIFEEAQSTGEVGTYPKVKADYNYNNLKVKKRTYNNNRIRKEALRNEDGKTFVGRYKNWLLSPNPVIYRLPHGKAEKEMRVESVASYELDYESGSIRFFEETSDRIYADYAYATDQELKVKDYDLENGKIYLESSIRFKDEIVVDYVFEEKDVEYRGYFDEEIGQFIHLDLNPSEGHYCTLPKVYQSRYAQYEEVPTYKLMNKEVYIYVLPYQTSLEEGKRRYTIRHCYSEAEWKKIQSVTLFRALLLGTVQLREHATVKNTTVLDTRVRGGGLKTSISNEVAFRKDPLTQSYWDMGQWEGTAYYKNGVVVIEVPRYLLQSEGGRFSEKDIEDAIRKHIAFGIFFIIEYSDIKKPTTEVPEEPQTPDNPDTGGGEPEDGMTVFIQGGSFAIKMKSGGS